MPTARETGLVGIFREPFQAANRAWNEGDFRRAYAGLSDTFVYHLSPTWPRARALHGRDEVVAFFEDFREIFPDARSGPDLELVEAGERTLVVGFGVVGTGRSSGAGTAMEIWQVWDMDERLVPLRVTEFHDRSSALDAARASRSAGQRS